MLVWQGTWSQEEASGVAACPPSERAAAAVWCRHASSPASACTSRAKMNGAHMALS